MVQVKQRQWSGDDSEGVEVRVTLGMWARSGEQADGAWAGRLEPAASLWTGP